MSDTMDLSADVAQGKYAWKTTFIYAVFGGLWILLSDRVVAALVSDSQTLTAIQTYKGWFYVLVTSVLIYSLVFQGEWRLHGLLRQLDQKNRSLHDEMLVQIENEKRIKKLMGDLTEKNKELEGIINAISHDLRTPLVNIKGFSGELCDSIEDLQARIGEYPEARDDERIGVLCREIPESLAFVEQGADKLNLLLNGLQEVCRLGFNPIHIETVSANDLLKRVVGSLRYQIDQCKAEITVEDLPECRADLVEFIRIFSNLIGNSIKYRRPDRPVCVKISGRREGDRVHYFVADNGIGIDPKYQEQIFKLYHQLDPSADGQGLGLAIVKRVLYRMNGEISVAPEPGGGTVFSITLPAVQG